MYVHSTKVCRDGILKHNNFAIFSIITISLEFIAELGKFVRPTGKNKEFSSDENFGKI